MLVGILCFGHVEHLCWSVFCVVAMLSICVGRAAAVPQEFGRTALMWAALKGHTEAVSVLVGAGAALDAVNKVGCAAQLHMHACQRAWAS